MPVLELKDLRRSFTAPDGSQQLILDIPAWALAQREQAALEGPSGSGKTTLLHCCAGLLSPDQGSVRLDGVDLAGLSESRRDHWRGQRLGMVFQGFHLLQSLSALENVELAMRFGAGLDRARARKLLERMGLGARLGHRPSQLSAGQQQRVAVARALANRPRVVLADEPTGSLDAAAGAETLALLSQACTEDGAALLLVSHDPKVLGRFKRRLRLRDLNRAALGSQPRRRRA